MVDSQQNLWNSPPAEAACHLEVARDSGYDVVATEHDLDDEVATPFRHLLHWQMGCLSANPPVVEATREGLVSR